MEPKHTTDSPTENKVAYIALFCGLASLLPLVILVTFIPAVVLGALGFLRSLRSPEKTGRREALLGIGLALMGLLWQASIAALGGLLGFLAG